MKKQVKFKSLLSQSLSPERIFILGFAGVILLGTLLLWFPFSATKHPLTFVNALFTSTSAVCVTGLTVLDIGNDLSLSLRIYRLKIKSWLRSSNRSSRELLVSIPSISVFWPTKQSSSQLSLCLSEPPLAPPVGGLKRPALPFFY